jgi:signal transduction histidine kinase
VTLGTSGIQHLNRNVRLYIAVVSALAVTALVAGSLRIDAWEWQNLTLWSLVCVLAELLWLNTLTGQGTVSMASTFNLAVIFLLGWEKSLWVVGASTLFANLAIQKKEWFKALFNTTQSVLSTAAAGLVFLGTGGVTLLPSTELSGAQQIAAFLTRFNDARLILPFLASGAVFHFANTFLVSGVIALASGQRVMPTWRSNYGYSEEIVSSLALLFLSPLVVLSYGAVSFLGIVLFFVPLVFVRDATMRYIQLQKAQDTLVRSERMVAKGEMAAEIGHELNNYLAAISGRAQILLMLAGPNSDPKLRKSAEIIYENTTNMATLTAGLMSAAHKETQKRPSNLNDLINKTIEFVKPQNKFDHIKFELDLDAAVPIGDLDPGQIQQVLLNLFSNAADALNAAGPADRRIVIQTRHDAERRQVVMTVKDNGCGMTSEVAARIFEPTFTTKEKGHGFGLSTSYRIIENHSGRIAVESEPGEGATFTVQLPLKAA